MLTRDLFAGANLQLSSNGQHAYETSGRLSGQPLGLLLKQLPHVNDASTLFIARS